MCQLRTRFYTNYYVDHRNLSQTRANMPAPFVRNKFPRVSANHAAQPLFSYLEQSPRFFLCILQYYYCLRLLCSSMILYMPPKTKVCSVVPRCTDVYSQIREMSTRGLRPRPGANKAQNVSRLLHIYMYSPQRSPALSLWPLGPTNLSPSQRPRPKPPRKPCMYVCSPFQAIVSASAFPGSVSPEVSAR